MTIGLAAIEEAAQAIAGAVLETPTVPAFLLSERFGCRLHLKLENLQRTGSFKERGALNKLASLDEEQRRQGVVAMSAGNHAQGVAYHAGRLRIPATIVMPAFTPFTKVARTEAYGATVVLKGDSLSEAEAEAERLRVERGLTLVHPYDDPLVIAGQGTAGLELLRAVPSLDTVLVPIGGGGLIAGIATAAKALKPSIRVVGVQSALYPAMRDALAGIERPYAGSTLAEGIAVKRPGRLTRAIIAELVDEIVVVEEPAIEDAVHRLLVLQKVLAEGAGAAGIAALLSDPGRFAGQTVGAIVCGGNIDPRLVASILMRGLARGGQLVRLRVEIDDSPGALAKVAACIGEAGANIVEVFHQRLVFSVPVKRADLDVVVETRDKEHVARLLDALQAAGFGAALLGEAGL